MAASAGGYASAIMGVADVLTGASADAAYEAAYGKFYSSYQAMHNAANQKVAAEANIAAIKQDRINTDKVIAMRQDSAEAQAKVAAAVSGTEGRSVKDVIYQSEINSSVAKSNNRATSAQQIENQLATVYQSTSTLLAVDAPQVSSQSLGMSLATGIGAIISDETLRGEVADGVESLFSGGSDIGIE